jgi:hypothetical protein
MRLRAAEISEMKGSFPIFQRPMRAPVPPKLWKLPNIGVFRKFHKFGGAGPSDIGAPPTGLIAGMNLETYHAHTS